MHRTIPFVKSELQVIERIPGMFNSSELLIRNTPVSARENYSALFDEKKPFWMPSIREAKYLHPNLYNNTLGRGVFEDIRDVFGVKWRYVPTVGGSTEDPDEPPLMADVNEWREKIKLPDIDAWDWAGAARDNSIDPRYPCIFSFINGFWFERLISFMQFMPAAMALIDEDQSDAIKELFDAMTDLGCRLVDKLCENWPLLDLIEIHDDWGSQNAPFFSLDVAEEFFVPCMRKINDHIHSWGRHSMLHSCGHNATRIQCYIDGGFDYWAPQTMNDIEMLYEEYGDKIVLAVFPTEKNIPQCSEKEQRAAARAFADQFCKPGKPAILGVGAMDRITPAFEEELYMYTRSLYSL